MVTGKAPLTHPLTRQPPVLSVWPARRARAVCVALAWLSLFCLLQRRSVVFCSQTEIPSLMIARCAIVVLCSNHVERSQGNGAGASTTRKEEKEQAAKQQPQKDAPTQSAGAATAPAPQTDGSAAAATAAAAAAAATEKAKEAAALALQQKELDAAREKKEREEKDGKSSDGNAQQGSSPDSSQQRAPHDPFAFASIPVQERGGSRAFDIHATLPLSPHEEVPVLCFWPALTMRTIPSEHDSTQPMYVELMCGVRAKVAGVVATFVTKGLKKSRKHYALVMVNFKAAASVPPPSAGAGAGSGSGSGSSTVAAAPTLVQAAIHDLLSCSGKLHPDDAAVARSVTKQLVVDFIAVEKKRVEQEEAKKEQKASAKRARDEDKENDSRASKRQRKAPVDPYAKSLQEAVSASAALSQAKAARAASKKTAAPKPSQPPSQPAEAPVEAEVRMPRLLPLASFLTLCRLMWRWSKNLSQPRLL